VRRDLEGKGLGREGIPGDRREEWEDWKRKDGKPVVR
jgi:hypothetical protein